MCRNYLPEKDLEENSQQTFRPGVNYTSVSCKINWPGTTVKTTGKGLKTMLINRHYLPNICLSMERAGAISSKKNIFFTWPEYICLRIISHNSPLHSSILFSCCSNIDFQDFSGIVAFSTAQINTNSSGFVNNDVKNPYIEGVLSSNFV